MDLVTSLGRAAETGTPSTDVAEVSYSRLLAIGALR
jgi:hypothetical protein